MTNHLYPQHGMGFPRLPHPSAFQAEALPPAVVEDPQGARITETAAIKAFVLAGKAIFTLRSLKTGKRYTFKVKKKNKNEEFYFVSVMTGSDNEVSYSYLGTINSASYRYGRKSLIRNDDPRNQAMLYLFTLIERGDMGIQLEFWHEGRCGRCGKTLTVPESIASGFGPECVKRQGALL